MAKVEKSIEIQVPVRTAYDQWTQFESFPEFMEGVKEVRQLDDRRLRWRAEVGGRELVWDAEITEQVPDMRIAWQSLEGARNAGVVTFHRLSDDRCKVMLQIDTEPEGLAETVGDRLGFLERRVEGDLERFRDFVAARGRASGAWRGEVPRPGEG
jgi:uncharacterized membrane protein